MSNRELVIDLVSKLPEDTPLEEIGREIELIAGIQVARDQARRGLGTPAASAGEEVVEIGRKENGARKWSAHRGRGRLFGRASGYPGLAARSD